MFLNNVGGRVADSDDFCPTPDSALITLLKLSIYARLVSVSASIDIAACLTARWQHRLKRIIQYTHKHRKKIFHVYDILVGDEVYEKII
jgi:hypothetical protein